MSYLWQAKRLLFSLCVPEDNWCEILFFFNTNCMSLIFSFCAQKCEQFWKMFLACVVVNMRLGQATLGSLREQPPPATLVLELSLARVTRNSPWFSVLKIGHKHVCVQTEGNNLKPFLLTSDLENSARKVAAISQNWICWKFCSNFWECREAKGMKGCFLGPETGTYR